MRKRLDGILAWADAIQITGAMLLEWQEDAQLLKDSAKGTADPKLWNGVAGKAFLASIQNATPAPPAEEEKAERDNKDKYMAAVDGITDVAEEHSGQV